MSTEIKNSPMIERVAASTAATVYMRTLKRNRAYHLIGVVLLIAAMTLVIASISETRFAESIATFFTALLAYMMSNSFANFGANLSLWKDTLAPVASWREKSRAEFQRNIGDRNLYRILFFGTIYAVGFVFMKGAILGMMTYVHDIRVVIALACIIAAPLIAPELIINMLRAIFTPKSAKMVEEELEEKSEEGTEDVKA